MKNGPRRAYARPRVSTQSSISNFQELQMTRMSSLFSTLLACAGLALAAANASAQMHDHGQHEATPAPTQDASTALSVGEVRKVDKDAGTLTIKHGPLNNLDMSGMTMVFKVQDTAMLDKAKVGDQIRFRAERVNDALTVTRLELAN
jgi:Cu/Ag efflux protein CusF